MRKLILCLGNEIAGDDGVAIYIAQRLRGKLRGWDIKESNKAGFYLLEDIEGYDEVIVVDSIIDENGQEGEIVKGEITDGSGGFSPHSLSMGDILKLGHSMGLYLPQKIKFYAIRIRTPEFGEKISSTVKASADKLILHLVEMLVK